MKDIFMSTKIQTRCTPDTPWVRSNIYERTGMGPAVQRSGVGGEMVSRPVWNDSSVGLHLESLFAYWRLSRTKLREDIAKSKSSEAF